MYFSARVQHALPSARVQLALPRALRASTRGILVRALGTSSVSFPELDAPHALNNVPPSIRALVRGPKLLRVAGHPLATLKDEIFTHFHAVECASVRTSPEAAARGGGFAAFESALTPVVSVAANFDDLLTPADHVSRRPSDTFYVDDTRVLRCHMTAHQVELLRAGHSRFLMAGDVYRRDTVDATHAPVFHQLDGVRVWSAAELPAAARDALAAGDAAPARAVALADLRATLEALAARLFPGAQTRWVDAHFPFTDPSLELEVFWDGKWLEVLGAGVVRAPILAATRRTDAAVGWAFGLGLERLAMVRHAIPDIRLFWSQDARFLAQFSKPLAPGAAPAQFESFSKHPACYKDIAFWVPAGTRIESEADADGAGRVAAVDASSPTFHENDVHAAVREVAGDLVESVECIDKFEHPKTRRTSLCFRILYRAPDRSLTNGEVDAVQDRVKAAVVALGFELR